MIPANDILAACIAQAIAQIDLTGDSGAPGIIDATSVPARVNVFQTEVVYTRDTRQRFADFPRPSLIFSCLKTHTPPDGGDNQKAITFYTIVAQIVDTEFNLLDTAKSNSRQKWDKNIRTYFHMGNLRNAVFDTSDGMVTLVMAGDTDQMDEKLFHARDDGVLTIPIIVKCWEPHNTAGRV